jgi:hypothetical protein
MTLPSQGVEVNMFRSIHFLIGILILLFVLTTLGFSGTAFAATCERCFDTDTPEYARDSDYEYTESDSEFAPTNSPSSHLDTQSADDYYHIDEFATPHEGEFDHSNTL